MTAAERTRRQKQTKTTNVIQTMAEQGKQRVRRVSCAIMGGGPALRRKSVAGVAGVAGAAGAAGAVGA
eukprot:19067-Prymnesium_polylepis.1